MKLFIGALAFVCSLSVLAAAPTREVFREVSAQAEELGYYGNDILVCLNEAGQVRLGGTSSWNWPLAIYLVDAEGQVSATTGLNPAGQDSVFQFLADGKKISLGLGQAYESVDSSGPNTIKRLQGSLNAEGTVMGPYEKLDCYYNFSGLE